MKKIILVIVALIFMFTVSACSGKKDVVSDESSDLLAKPEVTQASTKEKESGSSDSGSTSADRYKKIQYGDLELYLPNLSLIHISEPTRQ